MRVLGIAFGVFTLLAMPLQAADGGSLPEPIDPASWLTADDYPAEALKQGAQGSVEFRLDIDQDGTITNCTILRGSGSRELDDGTCRLMQERGRFKPAMDREGRTIASQVVRTVTWEMPDGLTTSGSAMRYVMQLDVQPDGSFSNCHIVERTMPTEFLEILTEAALCQNPPLFSFSSTSNKARVTLEVKVAATPLW